MGLLYYIDAVNSMIHFIADADLENDIPVYSADTPEEIVEGKVWVPEGLVDITVDGKPAKQQEWVLIDKNPNPSVPEPEPEDDAPPPPGDEGE
tara:strand:- start:192 stop:470 length:279 start_codon:yes stop_codon:yes gene_type:complete